MNLKRYNDIDMLKGLGIICVVAGHSTLLPEPIKHWVEAFHMALFFIAAGVMIGRKKSYKKSSEEILKQRFRTIMIPYFIFSLIAILWDTVGIYWEPTQYYRSDLVLKIWDSASFYGVSVLWFLPAFFVAVTGYQITRKFLPLWLDTILILGLVILVYVSEPIPDYINGLARDFTKYFLQLSFVFWRAAVGMFFCAIGEAAAWLMEQIKTRKGAQLLFALVLLVGGSMIAMNNETVSFRYLIMGNIAYFLLAGSSITVGLLLFCDWIGELKPIEYLGRNSMIIFLTHLDLRVMNVALKCSDKVFAWTDNHFVQYLTVGILLIIMEVVIIEISNRYLKFLFGGPMRKMKVVLHKNGEKL